MMPWPGLVEPFTECLGLGLLGAMSTTYLLGVSVPVFLLVHTVVWFCCDMTLLRIIEVRTCGREGRGRLGTCVAPYPVHLTNNPCMSGWQCIKAMELWLYVGRYSIS